MHRRSGIDVLATLWLSGQLTAARGATAALALALVLGAAVPGARAQDVGDIEKTLAAAANAGDVQFSAAHGPRRGSRYLDVCGAVLPLSGVALLTR